MQTIDIWLSADPPENCQLSLNKLPKTWNFFKKIDKNCQFFNKIAIGNFVEKNDNFCQFFWKNFKFLAIFWHSNGNFPEGQLLTKAELPTVNFSTRDNITVPNRDKDIYIELLQTLFKLQKMMSDNNCKWSQNCPKLCQNSWGISK